MKNFTLGIVAAIFLVACSPPWSKKSSQHKPAHNSPEVIASEFVFAGDPTPVKAVLASLDLADAEVTRIEPDLNQYVVKYKGADQYATIAEALEGQVEFIEPHYVVRAIATETRAEWTTDLMFFKQWAFNNIGQSAPFGLPGQNGADMDILKAWKKTKGSDKIVVAVIDTGVDYKHPELRDNIWVNHKESEKGGGQPGVDDDGNGYVDDVYGFDFYSTDLTQSWYGIPGDPDPMDEDGHGTHCAGAIGAKANNADGIAGVNWDVKIMAIRFLGPMGGSSVAAARAIRYATKNKADIMSNSWGGGGASKLIQSAISEAQAAGILFIAAAGNDGKNNDATAHYPSSYSVDHKNNPLNNMLTVGASDNQDNPAEFSNYGHNSVHVFAPGVLILSTYPTHLTSPGSRPFAVMSGTSMATPYVSGVAALALAANPGLKGRPDELKKLLMSSVDVKESLVGKAVSNGRINAFKAVTANTQAVNASQAWVTRGERHVHRGFKRELVDVRTKISVPGAKAIKVHFDFIQINEPYDSLYIYDKNFRLVGRVETTEELDVWSPAVPGDTMYVRYVNSLLQQIQSNPMMAPSEPECLDRGALEAKKVGDQYQCRIDAETSTSKSKDTFVSFNSEGFSVDQVSYLPGEGAKK